MWWSEQRALTLGTLHRRGVLGAGLGLLAACAFEPVFGPGGAGQRLDGQVEIAAPATRATFVMARALERQFGPAQNPSYRLTYRLSVINEDAAITSGQEIDRVNLIGTLRFSLRRRADNAELTRGTAHGFVSFSSIGDAVATQAARQDAQERLAAILADQTHTLLISDPALESAEARAP